MASQISNMQRLEIPYWEGVNALVGSNLSKKTELSYAENARCSAIGTIEKRQGSRKLGDDIVATANYHIFYFENTGTNGFYRISTVTGTTSIYYLSGAAAWTILSGYGTGLSGVRVESAIAEDCCFLVNGSDNNRYITSDGVTIYDSTTRYGHFYQSPKAYKINFYKNRLYLGHYIDSGGTEHKNGIMRSSIPLGLVALADGDHAAAVTTLSVTDIKYIYTGDALQVYRGGALVTATLGDDTSQWDITNPSGTTMRYTWDGTGTDPDVDAYLTTNSELGISGCPTTANNGTFLVTAVGSNYFEITNASGVAENDLINVTISIRTINVTAIQTENKLTIVAFNEDIQSSDEIWLYNTYTGQKWFRWADNASSGVAVKDYDTMTLSGSSYERIKMFTNIGDFMLIASDNNLSVWNDYNLTSFDIGIGCVSDRGYVKNGDLFFIHYSGIYKTNGTMPVLISSKIEPYIKGASKTVLNSAAMGKKGTSIFCALSSITLYYPDGSVKKTLSNVVLELDLRTSNWFVHTGWTATQFATYISTSDPDRLEFSSTESNYPIMEAFNGQVDDRVTSEKEILFRIDTDDISLSEEFENFVHPMELIVEAERGSGISAFVSLDGQAPYEVKGNIVKGCVILPLNSKDEKIAEPPRCRKIKISIRDYTSKLCRIGRVALRCKTTDEREMEHQITYSN